MLAEYLNRLAAEYAYERGKPFKGSAFGDFVRRDIATEAKKKISFWPFDLKIKSSVGNGQWASVPWLAFFDPLITETATRGFYVVYLINAQTRSIALSMNQGTTAVYDEFGESKGREVLARRAVDIRDRVSDFSKYFSVEALDLGSKDNLPRGYEAGHAFGRVYEFGALNEESLVKDLKVILEAYASLVERGGTLPADLMQEEAGSTDILETRRYVLSRRIERSQKVRSAVLALRKPICEACGLQPELDYNYSGSVDKTPLDVHHSKPLRGMAEGESRRYKVPDDFFVLCPTCHRMIHKQDDPSDIGQLKQKLRFKIMRETNYPLL